ncbi:hypothetical protein BH09MYX1_BH09MYX1_18500 [soil metagenome]
MPQSTEYWYERLGSVYRVVNEIGEYPSPTIGNGRSWSSVKAEYEDVAQAIAADRAFGVSRQISDEDGAELEFLIDFINTTYRQYQVNRVLDSTRDATRVTVLENYENLVNINKLALAPGADPQQVAQSIVDAVDAAFDTDWLRQLIWNKQTVPDSPQTVQPPETRRPSSVTLPSPWDSPGKVPAKVQPRVAPSPDAPNPGPLISMMGATTSLGHAATQSVARFAIAKKDHGEERAFGGPGGGSVLSKLRHGGGGHSGMFAVSESNEGLFTHKQRGPRGVNVLAANRGGSGGTAGSGKRNAPGPNPAPGRGTSDNKASASDSRMTGSEARGTRAETTPSSAGSRPAAAVDGGTITVTVSPTPAPNPPEDRGTGGGGSGSTGGSGTSGGSGSTGTSGNSGSSPNAPSGGSKGPPQAESKPVEGKGGPKKDPETPKEDPHKRPGGNPNPEDDGSGGGGGPRASGGENQSPNPEDSGSGGGGTNPRARISRLMPYDEDGGRRGGTGGGVGGPRAYDAYPDPESSGGGNPRARFEMPNPEDTRGPQGPSARISSNWRSRML